MTTPTALGRLAIEEVQDKTETEKPALRKHIVWKADTAIGSDNDSTFDVASHGVSKSFLKPRIFKRWEIGGMEGRSLVDVTGIED